MPKFTGETVKASEISYTVVSRTNAGSAGSKWFGKYVWILDGSDGYRYQYLGKQLTKASKLHRISIHDTI